MNVPSRVSLILMFLSLGLIHPVHAAEMAKGQKGTVTGTVTSKSQKWIEVRTDGSGFIKRYIPPGGLPEDDRAADPSVLEEIHQTRVNSRVQVDWEFQRRLRALNIKVLKQP